MNNGAALPMPLRVQRAYRDPIDLLGLFETNIYDGVPDAGGVRRRVREELLGLLIERYGDVWVPFWEEEMPVSRVVRMFGENGTGGIEMLLDVPDYGGRDRTLPLLAQAMQPAWARRWSRFMWNGFDDLRVWFSNTRHVLGPRQYVWIAAQCVRKAGSIVWPQSRDREIMTQLLESAEEWAALRDGEDAVSAMKASLAAYNSRNNPSGIDVNMRPSDRVLMASAHVSRAVLEYVGGMPSAGDSYIVFAINHAARALPEGLSPYHTLSSLVRSTITPTLITSAASSSGSAIFRQSR